MNEDTKANVQRRLKSIAGHVSGIERMVKQDTYCVDVIKQIQAVQAALNKVNDMILENHLHTCVISAVRGEDKDEREKVLGEIVSVFEMAQRI